MQAYSSNLVMSCLLFCRSCFGGVGRNIADVLACLDSNPFFISSVGNDPLGQSILRHNDKLDKTGISVNSDPTSSYCVVLDFKGQARIGIGDINQVTCYVTPHENLDLIYAVIDMLNGELRHAIHLVELPNIAVGFKKILMRQYLLQKTTHLSIQFLLKIIISRHHYKTVELI